MLDRGKKLAEHGIGKERIRYCTGGQREYCYVGGKIKHQYVNAFHEFSKMMWLE
jgi:hypothetical protein